MAPKSQRARATRDEAADSPRAPHLSPALVAALPLVLALVATVVVHYPALDTFFAQDDISFIARARGLIPTPWSLARPLSEGWVWRALVAAFGLHPFPYHAFNFALHLVNVTFVYAIGVRLLGGRVAAGAAAVLFGVSGIAFTPLHWISSLVELLVTTFSLASFLAFLRGRAVVGAGGRVVPWLWASAALLVAALLSKENAILLPVAFAVAHWRMGAPGAAHGAGAGATRGAGTGAARAAVARLGFTALAAPFTAAVLYAAGFLATLKTVHYIGSEAYARRFDLPHLSANAFTYLRWLVTPGDAVRDAVATVDPGAWAIGLVVLAGAMLALWTQRRAARHPEEAGAAWFVAALAPVIPLASHTYLYYLYLALPGACWMAAALGRRLFATPAVARLGWARAATAGALVAIVGVEFNGVRTREVAMVGAFEADHTQRESRLLTNALADLRAARLAPGDTIAFMNPGPAQRVRFGGDDPDAPAIHTYFPLEGAMRGGQTIDVFFPGIGYLGFARTIPPSWERARVFVFFDDGHLESIGRGAPALARLGNDLLAQERWAEAESVFVRSIALGDTLADAAYGLVAADVFQGRRERGMNRAAAFLCRFPGDPRAAQLATRLREESLMVARGR